MVEFDVPPCDWKPGIWVTAQPKLTWIALVNGVQFVAIVLPIVNG